MVLEETDGLSDRACSRSSFICLRVRRGFKSDRSSSLFFVNLGVVSSSSWEACDGDQYVGIKPRWILQSLSWFQEYLLPLDNRRCCSRMPRSISPYPHFVPYCNFHGPPSYLSENLVNKERCASTDLRRQIIMIYAEKTRLNIRIWTCRNIWKNALKYVCPLMKMNVRSTPYNWFRRNWMNIAILLIWIHLVQGWVKLKKRLNDSFWLSNDNLRDLSI